MEGYLITLRAPPLHSPDKTFSSPPFRVIFWGSVTSSIRLRVLAEKFPEKGKDTHSTPPPVRIRSGPTIFSLSWQNRSHFIVPTSALNHSKKRFSDPTSLPLHVVNFKARMSILCFVLAFPNPRSINTSIRFHSSFLVVHPLNT